MSEIQSRKTKINCSVDLTEDETLSIVDGEILEDANDERFVTKIDGRTSENAIENKKQAPNDKRQNQKSNLQYILLPLIFLVVALLGGLRFDAASSTFLFLKPALICLVFASALLFLFFRTRLIKLDGWFAERFSTAKNAANTGVLLTLFFASAQIFNSLLPERGLPFWTIAFCFFWTLWNNLFAEFDARKLIKSLVGMFALAFFVKYLILANLAAPPSESFWQRLTENPTKEAFTYLLDLPQFAAATGYVQFFTLGFYLIGLFLLKPETENQ